MDTTTNRTFLLHRQVRQHIAKLVGAFAPEQLNQVPEGAPNNLIWNAGHVIATAELLTYGLAGLPTPSGKEFINRYRKGTRPEGTVGQEEIDYIKRTLLAGSEDLHGKGGSTDWSGFQPYTTSLGVTLNDIGEALEFNNLHEMMHLGTMLLLRRLV